MTTRIDDDSTTTPETESKTPTPQIQVEPRKLGLNDFLKTLVKINGSDLHLQENSVPMIRVDGRPKFLDRAAPDTAMMDQIVRDLVHDPEKFQILEHRGAVDVSYATPHLAARFRTNVFHSRGKYAVTMRRIITKIPTFEELNLPPGIESMAEQHRGIVVVSGITGSGKTTTLAAILGKINRSRSERIITIEEPVEFQHENAKSLVSQVEIGTDNESYEYALKEVVRQDPDVILLGEIRDSFSLSTALKAADTGHLVFTTIHATTAPTTVDRMVSMFDPSQKDLQQQQLANNLVAVVCQRLAKRKEGKGRVPVIEIMMGTPVVRKYIAEGEFEKLKGTTSNREAGCQNFDQHLTELFQKQVIDVNEAIRLSSNTDALKLALRGIGNSDTRLTR